MELVCAALDPFVQLFQNFFDVGFTFLSLFGFSAPNVRSLIGDVTGCTF